jgi:serine/threonine-protein kinase
MDAEAYNRRGINRQARQDFAGAIADYDQAITLRPDYAEAYNNRGTARQAGQDLTGAIADYDRALALRPRYPEASNNRGTARQAADYLSAALADFDQAIALRPDYAAAYENRAAVHYRLWRHDLAATDYSRALGLYNRQAPPADLLCRLHLFRAEARYHSDDFAGALSDYRTAFRFDADLAARLLVSRLVQDVDANLAAVLADCARHLRQNHNDFLGLARRGLIRLLRGREVEAQQDFDRFLHCNPTNRRELELIIAVARRTAQSPRS